jgi:hypothetical protein
VTGRDYIGGFIGLSGSGNTIDNCYSTGRTSGNGDIGGFTGLCYGTIINCYSTGDVSGNYYLGGFAGGSSGGEIYYCYSTGSASGDSCIGGFIGDSSGGFIFYCYSIGNASANSFVGGFGGFLTSVTLYYCYSTGTVSGHEYEGGFIGYSSLNSINSCYWDTQTSGISSSGGGTGKTTSEMKQKATFTNWNFTSPWNIIETRTYPYLITGSPIITTQQVTKMDIISEDSLYLIDFHSSPEPDPGSNTISTWSVKMNCTGWLSCRSNIASGTPSNSDVGIFFINITATDVYGRTGSLNYTVTRDQHGPGDIDR